MSMYVPRRLFYVFRSDSEPPRKGRIATFVNLGPHNAGDTSVNTGQKSISQEALVAFVAINWLQVKPSTSVSVDLHSTTRIGSAEALRLYRSDMS